MSIFDSVKGALFEDEPTKQDNTGAPTKPFKPPASEYSILPSAGHVTYVAGSSDLRSTVEFGSFKTKIYPASGSLSAFLSTYDSLAAVITDEQIRFKASIQVSKANGFGLEAILADIDKANQNLTTEKQNIELARANKLNGEVAQTENRAKEIALLIEAKAKEISELKTQQDTLSENAKSARTQIEKKTVTYMAALSQIAADLDSLEQKLKGAK